MLEIALATKRERAAGSDYKACKRRYCEAREPTVAREERSTRRRVVMFPVANDSAEAWLTEPGLLSSEGRRNEVEYGGSGELAGPETTTCHRDATP